MEEWLKEQYDAIVAVARVCHETNKAHCENAGDLTQLQWEDTADWIKESAIKGVIFRLENPDAPASATHDAWYDHKVKEGWVYGEVKDAEKKTHPCLVAYDQLSVHDRLKDYLFGAVVKAHVDAGVLKARVVTN